VKSKDVNTGWSNLAESSKEGYDSKGAVLLLLLLMMVSIKPVVHVQRLVKCEEDPEC
jgi:hypothetical protein